MKITTISDAVRAALALCDDPENENANIVSGHADSILDKQGIRKDVGGSNVHQVRAALRKKHGFLTQEKLRRYLPDPAPAEVKSLPDTKTLPNGTLTTQQIAVVIPMLRTADELLKLCGGRLDLASAALKSVHELLHGK